ncbi:hypothetical protein [Clostridium sp. AF37-7]|uniref:hypothetical protein n=1 Tax=Clostridium sp. AF37-7 TaxID=2293017 RepID=UPI000E52797C|nr:hypothetical protein DW023_13985 [Clostridium sp. AF37-7]
MATYKTGWLRLPTDAKDFKERFAWSHVKAIFYDKAKNILLKDKLDAMDKLISDHADAIANKLMTNDAFNTAIADYVTKSMMSGVQVNDGDHVPTSALAYAMQQAITANANAITRLNSELDSTRNFFVFKTVSQKSITAGTTGFWHEKIKIPVGYKVLYVSATYNNADNCMLTPYDSVIASIGNTSDIEPWFGFYASQTGTGTFTAYAVCVKI